MNEMIVLYEYAGLRLTAYGLTVAVGALLGIILTCVLSGNVRRTLGLSAAVILGSLLGARLAYCAAMFDTFRVDYAEQGGLLYMLYLWQGGYSMVGAILGGIAGAAIWAGAHHQTVRPVLDLLAPGAALALCVGRLAEYFTNQGLGKEIENELFWFFPAAVTSPDDIAVMPIFLWEAIAALIAMIIVLRKPAYDGRAAGNFLVLISLTQIILDSLREDEYLRFGFVHFNQLAAAAALLIVLILRVIRCIRLGAGKFYQIFRIVLLFVGAGIVILVEFALDKSTIENWILYLVMIGALILMGLAEMRDGISIRGKAE